MHCKVQRPSLHARPDGQTGFRSATPSQSLSRPSHTSVPGSTQPSHTKPRTPRHTRWPALQVPTPTWLADSPGQRHVMPVWVKLPLSTTPSQLSSMPVHTSVVAVVPASPLPLHTMRPFAHAVTPAWHAPRVLPQLTPTPGSMPLSTTPSQSSSMLLHSSCIGVTTGASHTVP